MDNELFDSWLVVCRHLIARGQTLSPAFLLRQYGCAYGTASRLLERLQRQPVAETTDRRELFFHYCRVELYKEACEIAVAVLSTENVDTTVDNPPIFLP